MEGRCCVVSRQDKVEVHAIGAANEIASDGKEEMSLMVNLQCCGNSVLGWRLIMAANIDCAVTYIAG